MACARTELVDCVTGQSPDTRSRYFQTLSVVSSRLIFYSLRTVVKRKVCVRSSCTAGHMYTHDACISCDYGAGVIGPQLPTFDQ